MAITLTINGQRHQLKVEPRVTLLDAMRTRLDITGMKRVCDRGSCGACTVIIDGRTYYSCSLLAIETQGRNIRTVEGLAQGNTLHPVQQAFCDNDALDVRLLHAGLRDGNRCVAREERRRPRSSKPSAPSTATSAGAAPTSACSPRRCGRRRESWLSTRGCAELPHCDRRPVAPVDRRRASPRGAGTGATGGSSEVRMAREGRVCSGRASAGVDGPVKTTGRAKYSYDITRPGMIYGKILRSPHAHARVQSIDITAAQKAPGVRAAMATIQPGQKVMYAGEEVAAVAASPSNRPRTPVRLIKVDWEVLPHLATVEQAMRPEAPKVFEPAQHADAETPRKKAMSPPASQAPRTLSKAPTRRRSRRTRRSKRTAASASGTARTSRRGFRRRRCTARATALPAA